MIEKIMMGEKEIAFKSSAATNILFKKTFHEDITLKLTEYSRLIEELKKLQGDINEVKVSDIPEADKLAKIGEVMNSPAFVKSADFQSDTLPKLAYIMYLEANEAVDNIFKKLTEEHYLIWLMTFDQEELGAHISDILTLWRKGARQMSKAKN